MTSAAEKDLLALQFQFAGTIRDPDGVARPGDVPEARMTVYRELFFKNIVNGLESVYPVAHGLLTPQLWEQMTRKFWRDHRAQVPEYPRMAGEFLDWLDTTGGSGGFDTPPWLFDLLVWEHAELEAMLAEDDDIDVDGDPIGGRPVLTRSLQVFAFDYAVHRISDEWQPDTPEQTFLACYRTPQDQIDFMELTPASATLLERMRTEVDETGQQHIDALAEQMGVASSDIAAFAGAFIQELRDRHIIVAVRS